MTSSAPDFVVSGVPYSVTDVEGRTPAGTGDLTGRTTFAVEGYTGRHVVSGEGVLADDGSVRFLEKDPAAGKDVRAWRIREEADGRLVAQTD
ncbi:hypothetical protein [Georgenia sp. AZ-5]|uniref:hypothetical protein n=1 Tax=Georgenia sp. AZ-5 TaxID=3367526 RepID=UPI0037546A6A